MNQELETIQNLYKFLIEFGVTYGFQILGAIIILIIGSMVSKWVARLIRKLCEQKSLDVTLAKFLASTVKLIVLAFAVIIAMGKFGISIAPFIAALGAAAFGASLAIQGPLSNYGAGLSIILGRPFTVGNTLTVKGMSGVVENVTLAHTQLSTEDGENITIPNKLIIGEILVNSAENRVVESVVGISYDDDPQKAIALIQAVLAETPQITHTPEPQIGIEALGDFAIQIGLRYWVPTKLFFETQYAVNLSIFNRLKEEGITIPYPRRDVFMIEPKVPLEIGKG